MRTLPQPVVFTIATPGLTVCMLAYMWAGVRSSGAGVLRCFRAGNRDGGHERTEPPSTTICTARRPCPTFVSGLRTQDSGLRTQALPTTVRTRRDPRGREYECGVARWRLV